MVEFILIVFSILLGTYVIVVFATDGDSAGTNNGTFDMRIVSVTPEPSGFEFYMNQNNQYGNISFRGCLDYEVRGV